MKALVALLMILVVLVEVGFSKAFRDPDLQSWDYPTAKDPTPCQFNCNNAADENNLCVGDECSCAQGFGGSYCTCEYLCRDPFGTCNDDISGTCTCLPGWKGRNCNCPANCPDSSNWQCKTGDTVAERGCKCLVDGQAWSEGKKCCPTACSGLMSCPSNNGNCYCPTTNTTIRYGSSADKYKCCESFCYKYATMCECRTDGCFVKATNQKATSEDDCKPPAPGSCATHDSWEECSIVHWQGRCSCAPGGTCSCKCWYGWAGGNGKYALPGWPGDFKALYADHCRNRCDWTHDYQPAYCSKCEEVACPECNPPRNAKPPSKGAKKCEGTQ